MISWLWSKSVFFIKSLPKWFYVSLAIICILIPFLSIISAKIYQQLDNDPMRGAINIEQGKFDERYSTPEYLDQGWQEKDSLWFYNTTQGSAFLPYDFLKALEQPKAMARTTCKRGNEEGAWFLCPKVIDDFRYLPQKKTFFNPDALPVGFVKERYKGKDYVGLTCAACHTAQINYKGSALRIDGGPAMSDMVGFLTSLTNALKETQQQGTEDNPRFQKFVERVIAFENDYDNQADIKKDLDQWVGTRSLYNIINHSSYTGKNATTSTQVPYGYARLDAFGRIYNRVLQFTINIEQIESKLKTVYVNRDNESKRLITDQQIRLVLTNGIESPDAAILQERDLFQIIKNLQSNQPNFPNLSITDLLRVRNVLFNSANAPVSYPFLWDITHSDYVQWNGVANNAGLGPLGRNTGEVIGVFAILDWQAATGLKAKFNKFSLSAFLTDQTNKEQVIEFDSSVDLFNLQRLERQLISLKSPEWPYCKSSKTGEYYLPAASEKVAFEDRIAVNKRSCMAGDKKLDEEAVARGAITYQQNCQSCHDVIDREDAKRLVIGKFVPLSDEKESTDDAMASNSVLYSGKSGNFKNTYQSTDVGSVVIREDAPVVQILTAATKGVIGTADPDKWWPQRIVEWVYTLTASFLDTPIKSSVKAGSYNPDTTAKPYESLKAYKARSLNGIWATAPYLHNGSVPTLHDLLLPQNAIPGQCDEARPTQFKVGAREFDPIKVGFISEGYDGFTFDTSIRGNTNKGHEYGACSFTKTQREDLVEYLRSL